MKAINLKLVNEINQSGNLDYTVEITNLSVSNKGKIQSLQRLDFVNKHNRNVKEIPVIGTPLHIQYYLLGMQKYAKCIIPF